MQLLRLAIGQMKDSRRLLRLFEVQVHSEQGKLNTGSDG
jgi:hypothetical protein